MDENQLKMDKIAENSMKILELGLKSIKISVKILYKTRNKLRTQQKQQRTYHRNKSQLENR